MNTKPKEIWFSETSGLPKWFARACVEKAHADYIAERDAAKLAAPASVEPSRSPSPKGSE